MKEIYSSNHMWKIFENSFVHDIQVVIDKAPSAGSMENYVLNEMMTILISFFSSPFSDQSTVLSQRQIVFIELLQKVFKLTTIQIFSLKYDV